MMAKRICVVFAVLLFASGQSEDGRGPYTVKLVRQAIPLHTDGGVVQFKSAYHGRISVGSPEPQVMDVVFDTGSGHLVLPSTLCRAPTCLNHMRYRRKASSSAVDIDGDGSTVGPGQPRDQITVSYGTGEITGIFIRDQVCLGHKESAPAVATPHSGIQSNSLLQTKTLQRSGRSIPLTEDDVDSDMEHGCTLVQFVAATHMSEDPFGNFAFDGVLGLGLSGLSQTPSFNFFEVAANNKAFASMPGFERTFAVFLGTSNEEESSITFGGYRPEHLEQGTSFSWHNVIGGAAGYWQIDVRGIRAGGKRLDYCDDGTCRAVVDTGTSLLGVPSTLGPMLVDHLRFTRLTGQDCISNGLKLEFDLGNFTIELDPRDISRPEYFEGEAEGEPSTPPTEEEANQCVPMLMYLDLPDPLSPKTIILGEPVLQKYYTAFFMDLDSPRVGFGLAKHAEARMDHVHNLS